MLGSGKWLLWITMLGFHDGKSLFLERTHSVFDSFWNLWGDEQYNIQYRSLMDADLSFTRLEVVLPLYKDKLPDGLLLYDPDVKTNIFSLISTK